MKKFHIIVIILVGLLAMPANAQWGNLKKDIPKSAREMPTPTFASDTTKAPPKILRRAGNMDLSRFKMPDKSLDYIPETNESTETTDSADTIEITESTEREGVDLEGEAENVEYYLGTAISSKLNIFKYIYSDKNPNSNFYYYLPSTYTLKWDKRNGEYSFHIRYMSAEEIGEKGDVLFQMKLVSNITTEDILLAQKLLSEKLKKTVKLIQMPVEGVSTDLENSLASFDVKPESVIFTASTDYMQPIAVEWKMESRVDDFISAMLDDYDLAANMEYLLPGERVTTVPINLQVNDPITFGKIEIENPMDTFQNGWVNYLEYPIVLSHLILIREQSNGTLKVDELAIETDKIAPEAMYNFDLISNQNNIQRAWFDYAILECGTCNEIVRKKIVGGTSGSQITNLNILIMNIMETSEAYMFMLNLKSVQADPNGVKEVKMSPITIKEDDVSLPGGNYYVPENEELSYKYQLIQIMPNGETKTGPWKKGNQKLLVIGESQLETIFTEDSIEIFDDNDIEMVKDSLIDKGKTLLEDLFKKKEKGTINN